MPSFKQYISETKGRLDLSIQSADKYLSSSARIKEFLSTPLIVEQKSDGIKLTLIKQANTGQAEDDYILAYENKIIYANEFSYDTRSNIRKNSKGLSQLALVWEHLRKTHKNKIPIGTEMFLEFSMNTPNASGDHSLTLIGHTSSTWTTNQGILVTKPSAFSVDNREIFAEALGTKTPVILFEGLVSSQSIFANNITDKSLRDVYRKSSSSWMTDTDIINNISNMFLESSTKTPGIKGVVIKYNDVVIKLQSDTILESKKISNIYEDYLDEKVSQFIKGISYKEITTTITEIAEKLKTITDNTYDIVKLREDIQIKARKMLSLKMPGNQGILFLGKFKELTEKQSEIIKEATIKYDTVTIALLSSKDTRGTKESRNNMLRESFPEVEIINTSMTNIDNIINKSHHIISRIVTESNMGDKNDNI